MKEIWKKETHQLGSSTTINRKTVFLNDIPVNMVFRGKIGNISGIFLKINLINNEHMCILLNSATPSTYYWKTRLDSEVPPINEYEPVNIKFFVEE